MLTKEQQKLAKKITAKVNEWLARGTSVENIQKCLINNWYILSSVKDGVLSLAMFEQKRNTRRGGWDTGQQVIFATIELK